MASIGLKINDSSGTGINSGVADVFAKALFGDPEAAAKIALAKAQIANYGASTALEQDKLATEASTRARLAAEAANANSSAAKSQAEMKIAQDRQDALNKAVPGVATVFQNQLNKPQETRTQRPPEMMGRMPAIVTPPDPVAMSRYQSSFDSAPDVARAILLNSGTDPAGQIGKFEGSAGLLTPDPQGNLRPAETLYTGTVPSKESVGAPGDLAGVQAQAALDAANARLKPPELHIIDNPDNTKSQSVFKDGRWIEIPLEGAPGPKPADPTTDAQVQARIDNINSILRVNPQADITPDQAAQYATDINRRIGTQMYTKVDQQGNEVSYESYKALPQGTARPEDVWNLAGKHGQRAQPTAQTVGGQTLGAPVPIQRSAMPLPTVPTAQVRQAAMPVPVQMFNPATAGLGSPGGAGNAPAAPNPWPLVSTPGIKPLSLSQLPAAMPMALQPPAAAPAAAPVVPPVQTNEHITKLAPPDPALSGEFPSKSRGFAERMAEAVPFFNDIKPENIPSVVSTIANIPGDNIPLDLIVKKFDKDPAAKLYVQKALAAAFPGLRFDSGAAISKEEISAALATEIPLPGDDQRVIDAKTSAMAAHLRGILSSGYGLNSNAYNNFKDTLKNKRGYDLDFHDTSKATDIVFDERTGAVKSTKPAAPPQTPQNPAPAGKNWTYNRDKGVLEQVP